MQELIEKYSKFSKEELENEKKMFQEKSKRAFINATKQDEYGALDMGIIDSEHYENIAFLIEDILRER